MLVEKDCVKGLPVRLALGAVIDTSLSRLERPSRFVADPKAPDGRRRVPECHVDGKGRILPAPPPEPRPPHGKLRGPARAPSQGDPPEVVVDFEDGQWAPCGLDKLERCGDAPTPAQELPPSAEETLGARLSVLEDDAKVRAANARKANDPGMRFVTAKELGDVAADVSAARLGVDAHTLQIRDVAEAMASKAPRASVDVLEERIAKLEAMHAPELEAVKRAEDKPDDKRDAPAG